MIALMLSSETLKKDDRNHCVSVLDVFEDDDDKSMSYMVMPYLLPIHRPPFETVYDIVDCVDQLLKVWLNSSSNVQYAHSFWTGFDLPSRARDRT